VAVNASKSLVTSSWKKKRTELSDGKYESFNKPYYSDVNERELFDCVMRLAPKYRTVVYLFYYEDYSVEKVAKLMNISKSAVTTRLSRAREQLKNTFLREENGHEREYQKNV
jgi:RNA polymerase sigma-70 factor (ECF subfamily)